MAPKLIIPLAYDAGGVTAATVAVPLVAALGLGLSETVPGRNPLIGGFGLIAFARLFDRFGLTNAPVIAEGKTLGVVSYSELVLDGLSELIAL